MKADAPLCECGCAWFKHLNDNACRNPVCPCNSYRPRGGWEAWRESQRKESDSMYDMPEAVESFITQPREV